MTPDNKKHFELWLRVAMKELKKNVPNVGKGAATKTMIPRSGHRPLA